MPPPLAPRPDAGDLRGADRRARDATSTPRAAKPNPGVRTFQRLNRAEYSRAIHDLLGARRRRRQLAAARHQERELRQHRRRAGAVADAARGVPQRGERDQPHGGRRSQRADRRLDLQQRRLRVAASVGSRRRRAVRHARRHRSSSTCSRPTPSTSSRSTSSPASNARVRGHRHLDQRRARRADRVRDRPAGGADGRGAVPMRTEPILVHAGQHAWPRRSCASSKARTKISIRPHDWSFAGGGSGGPASRRCRTCAT